MFLVVRDGDSSPANNDEVHDQDQPVTVYSCSQFQHQTRSQPNTSRMFSYNHSKIGESTKTLTEAEVYYDADPASSKANNEHVNLPTAIPIATPVYDSSSNDTTSLHNTPNQYRNGRHRNGRRPHYHHGFCPFRLAKRAGNKIAAKRIQRESRYASNQEA